MLYLFRILPMQSVVSFTYRKKTNFFYLSRREDVFLYLVLYLLIVLMISSLCSVVKLVSSSYEFYSFSNFINIAIESPQLLMQNKNFAWV